MKPLKSFKVVVWAKAVVEVRAQNVARAKLLAYNDVDFDDLELDFADVEVLDADESPGEMN